MRDHFFLFAFHSSLLDRNRRYFIKLFCTHIRNMWSLRRMSLFSDFRIFIVIKSRYSLDLPKTEKKQVRLSWRRRSSLEILRAQVPSVETTAKQNFSPHEKLASENFSHSLWFVAKHFAWKWMHVRHFFALNNSVAAGIQSHRKGGEIKVLSIFHCRFSCVGWTIFQLKNDTYSFEYTFLWPETWVGWSKKEFLNVVAAGK